MGHGSRTGEIADEIKIKMKITIKNKTKSTRKSKIRTDRIRRTCSRGL